MARYLALDLDQRQVRIVAFGSSRGDARIDQALTYSFTEDLTASSAETLGKGLRDHLKQQGVAPAPILACVGRDRLIFKEVRFPPVPAHEEPALVRFQASKELNEPPSEVVIDYLVISGSKDAGQRRAMAMVLRRDVLRALDGLARALGVKLVGVVPRPLAMSGALERVGEHKPTQGAAAVLNATDRWAELSILRNGVPWYSRALPAGPGLMQDVRRSLKLYAAQEGEEDLPQVLFLSGRHPPETLDAWRDAVGLTVHGLDPFRPADKDVPVAERGGYLGAAGLAQIAGTPLPMNFVRPHEGGPAPGMKQKHWLMVGAAAGIAFLIMLLVGYIYVSSQRSELDALRADIKDMDDKVKKMSQDKPTVDNLREWEAGSLSWIDEFYDISAHFPHEEGMKINSLIASAIPRKSPAERFTGRIKVEGVAPLAAPGKRDLVAEFVNSLLASKRGDGKPKAGQELIRVNPEREETVDKARKFNITIDLVRTPPPEFHSRFEPPKKAPSRPPEPKVEPKENPEIDPEGEVGP